MDTAETSANQPAPHAPDEAVAIAALASAAVLAAAGGLFACSLFPSRKRPSVPGQICLGLIAAAAAAVLWNKRQEEATAARHLMSHIHEVRDTRWLKKHPIAYG